MKKYLKALTSAPDKLVVFQYNTKHCEAFTEVDEHLDEVQQHLAAQPMGVVLTKRRPGERF